MNHFLYDYDKYVEVPKLTTSVKIFKKLKEFVKVTLLLTLILTVLKVSNVINSPYTVISPILLHSTVYVIFCVVNYIKNYLDEFYKFILLIILGLSATSVFLLIIRFQLLYEISFIFTFIITLLSIMSLLRNSLINVSYNMSESINDWKRAVEHNKKVEERKHIKQIHAIDKNEGKQFTDYEVIKNKKTLVFKPIRKGER